MSLYMDITREQAIAKAIDLLRADYSMVTIQDDVFCYILDEQATIVSGSNAVHGNRSTTYSIGQYVLHVLDIGVGLSVTHPIIDFVGDRA